MSQLGMIIAMAAPGGAASGQQQSPAFMFGWIFIMLGIFYVMLIRPQKKREKERQALLAAVKSGDRIVFSGGILGVVTNVKEKTLAVKIADNVKIEIGRGAVSQILSKGEKPEDEST